MGIELHIEELVLHGFEARDRHRIAGEVERELARLVGKGDGLKGLRGDLTFERVNAGVFQVQAGMKPQAAGKRIAQSVYRSLRQQGLRQHAGPSRPGDGGRRA